VSTESAVSEADLMLAREPSIDVARLRVALARLSRRLRRHEIAGLTPTQLAALATVGNSGPMRLGDLAAAEGIAPSTLTRLVTALEEAGYVRRCADPSDARASMLAITQHGEEVLERIRSESTLVLAASLKLLTPEQRAALAAALPVLEQLAETPGSARPLRQPGPLSRQLRRYSSSARRRASSSRSLVTSASWRSSSMMRRMACRVMPSSAMETTCWMMRIS
jgi:DNA-binding MarR family transcriptional regulator